LFFNGTFIVRVEIYPTAILTLLDITKLYVNCCNKYSNM